MNRSIKTAINIKTGEILNADLIFRIMKDGQKIREIDKQTDGDDFCCYECGQLLETTSKNKNVFFRHKKGYSFCDLTDDQLSQEDENDFARMNKIKEESQESYTGRRSSEGVRHYNLKKLIVSKLNKTQFVTEVQDEKIVRNDFQIRRADVYCEFNGKRIVFEIQMSKLSARYIFSRYNFYKSNGIFLIWIIDVNLKAQDQFSIDIKYLNEYQNYFNIDESKVNLQLICKHKEFTITPYNELRMPWTTKTLELTQLKFNEEIFQAYYYDLVQEQQKMEKIRQERIKEEEKEGKLRIQIEEIKKHESYIKWKDNWIQKFNKSFQQISEFGIKNSNGTILVFAKEDINAYEIKSLESQFPNLIWVVNAKNFSRNFEFKEILASKIEQFNFASEKYLEKTSGELNKSSTDEKNTIIANRNKKERELKKLNEKKLKLENELENKSVSARNYLLYFWDETSNKIDKTTDLFIEIEKLYKQNILADRLERYHLQKQKDEFENNIKIWQEFKGSIVKDMILRMKPASEITFEKLSSNPNRILVRSVVNTSLIRLNEFDIESVLNSPQSYTLYDDYSVSIEEWEKEIQNIELKIESNKTILKEIQHNIEKEISLWVETRLSDIQKDIKAKTTEIEADELNIEQIEKELISEIKNVANSQEVLRKEIVKKYKSEYEVDWNSYKTPFWNNVNKPVFLELENGLYLFEKQRENTVKFIEMNKFIKHYNV